jgi:hypothetical protein
LQAVVVNLDDLADLVLLQVFVASADEISHRNDGTLLDLLVDICFL